MTKQEAEAIYGKPLTDEQFARLAAARGERAEFVPAGDTLNKKEQTANQAVVIPKSAWQPQATPEVMAQPGAMVMKHPETASYDPKSGTWSQAANPQPNVLMYGTKSPMVVSPYGAMFAYPDTSPAAIHKDRSPAVWDYSGTMPNQKAWQESQAGAEAADAEEDAKALEKPVQVAKPDGSGLSIGHTLVNRKKKPANPYDDI